jgi:hypothetical protein
VLQGLSAVNHCREVEEVCGLYVHVILRPYYRVLFLLRGKRTGCLLIARFSKMTRSLLFVMQFPLEWEWWLINVISSVFMASLGEYICSRNELEDIPLYAPS